ncbi:MAG TPA: hypothetical protein DCQ34_05590, partial [Chitinophagaceae bacterium]|nr:hypothetical protein [Chitinophagaceae bacterium]
MLHWPGADKDGKYIADDVDQFEAVLKSVVADGLVKLLPVPAQYNVVTKPQATLVAVVTEPFK